MNLLSRYQAYERYLYRKRVALVGPYKSPKNSELADYDVVVRFNAGYQPTDRREVLYHNGGFIPDAEMLAGIKWLILRSTTRNNEITAVAEQTGTRVITFSTSRTSDIGLNWWYMQLTKLTPGPTIGMTAFYHMLCLPVREIHLLAQNLYAHLACALDNGHNPKQHAYAIANLLTKDERIYIDGHLEKALEAFHRLDTDKSAIPLVEKSEQATEGTKV